MTATPAIRYAKMNGLGNEIVVVDLRGSGKRFTTDEAASIAAAPRTHFDQMMVLHDPETPETDARILIYNTDGSEAGACGNGTHPFTSPTRDSLPVSGTSERNAPGSALYSP